MNNSSPIIHSVIKQMLTPIKNQPLNTVIKALSGYTVIPFNGKDKQDKSILFTLTKVADDVLAEVNKNGIEKNRANEVGNAIEPFVKESLTKYGYQSDTPKASSGKRKASGYPDIEFIDEFKRHNYLECKTYNINKANDSQRSFFISPSNDFKVCQDAHHFGISFAMKNPVHNIYCIHSWQILDLSKITLDVKYEFNTNNKNLYAANIVIASK